MALRFSQNMAKIMHMTCCEQACCSASCSINMAMHRIMWLLCDHALLRCGRLPSMMHSVISHEMQEQTVEAPTKSANTAGG